MRQDPQQRAQQRTRSAHAIGLQLGVPGLVALAQFVVSGLMPGAVLFGQEDGLFGQEDGVSGENLAHVERRDETRAALEGVVLPAPRARSATNAVRGESEVSRSIVSEAASAEVRKLDREREASNPRGVAVRKVRKRRSSTPPWVTVQSLVPPSVETAEVFEESIPEEPRVPWYVVDRDAVDYEKAPDYVAAYARPLFFIPPRPNSRIAQAVERVAKRKFYSELRSEAKRQWRKVYASRPRMRFSEYESRLLDINRLGRKAGEGGLFDQDYYTTALKEDLFEESYREGESDIPLVAWGPFVVTDAGSMRVDVGRLVEFDEYVTEPKSVELEAGENEKKPFLQNEDYRVHTNVRLHFDPLGPVEEEDPSWLIKRYGVAVTVDWLSDVLGKEMLSAEVEAEVDRDGDFGVALNFIIRSRN